MIETIFGSKSAALMLRFIEMEGEGYGRKMAMSLGVPETPIVYQLKKFEKAGILVCSNVITAKVYKWNNDHHLVGPLRGMIQAQLKEEKRISQITAKSDTLNKGRS